MEEVKVTGYIYGFITSSSEMIFCVGFLREKVEEILELINMDRYDNVSNSYSEQNEYYLVYAPTGNFKLEPFCYYYRKLIVGNTYNRANEEAYGNRVSYILDVYDNLITSSVTTRVAEFDAASIESHTTDNESVKIIMKLEEILDIHKDTLVYAYEYLDTYIPGENYKSILKTFDGESEKAKQFFELLDYNIKIGKVDDDRILRIKDGNTTYIFEPGRMIFTNDIIYHIGKIAPIKVSEVVVNNYRMVPFEYVDRIESSDIKYFYLQPIEL
jgi:hypothetical protein